MLKLFQDIMIFQSQEMPVSLIELVLVIVHIFNASEKCVILFRMLVFESYFFFLCPWVDFFLLLMHQFIFLQLKVKITKDFFCFFTSSNSSNLYNCLSFFSFDSRFLIFPDVVFKVLHFSTSYSWTSLISFCWTFLKCMSVTCYLALIPIN